MKSLTVAVIGFLISIPGFGAQSDAFTCTLSVFKITEVNRGGGRSGVESKLVEKVEFSSRENHSSGDAVESSKARAGGSEGFYATVMKSSTVNFLFLGFAKNGGATRSESEFSGGAGFVSLDAEGMHGELRCRLSQF